MINDEMYELGNQSSVIRELYEYGKKRKMEIGNDNVYDFSIGNPSVPCPEQVTHFLKKIIDEMEPTSLHGYSSSVGHDYVRKAIAEFDNITYNTNQSYKYIYLTPGAAAAITISLNAIINKNDEVIVFAPFFPEYKVFVEKANGTLKIVQSDINSFLPNFDEFKKSINKNTKAVIINSPNNPTGVVYHEDTILKLCNILKEKEKEFEHPIYLLSDEPYKELIYDNYKCPYIANYYNNSIIIYSFSKSLSLPGERIGYILVSNSCINKEQVFKAICGSGRALGFVCESTLFQHLIPYCLGKTSNIQIYKENRDLLYNYLKKLGYEVVYPEGAFYLFVKALQDDAITFSNIAKQFELLLVPSDSFGIKGYVRISYCVSKKQICNSFTSFEKLMKYYKNGE